MLLIPITISFSAFFIFLVQPLIGKFILPWFGGAAAVWSACLLFFQAVLFLGYAYAHWLRSSLKPKAQAWTHAAVVLLSLLALPITPSSAWKPQGQYSPELSILAMLLCNLGPTYFVLSATSPLLQSWAAANPKIKSPYSLYSLSNFFSLLALLVYPTLLEPNLSVAQQGAVWAMGYRIFACFCVCCAIFYAPKQTQIEENSDCAEAAPSLSSRLLWVGLSGCGSALLLAFTNFICSDIAVVPFLWVIPLVLYLLTFVICFHGSFRYSRRMFLYAAFLLVALAVFPGFLSGIFGRAGAMLLLSFGAMFLSCMVCHGELAASKPNPRFLTSFYLTTSFGGALGGFFVSLVAPHIFSNFVELPIAVILCCGFFALGLGRQSSSENGRKLSQRIVAASSLLAICAILLWPRLLSGKADQYFRNFYGVIKVSNEVAQDPSLSIASLSHGITMHGVQFLSPEKRNLKTAYYGEDTGIGLTLNWYSAQGPKRVGVVGLGVGTVAAYGGAGDYFRFYEINPIVIDIAKHRFFYLSDSKASIDYVEGDGRLALESENVQSFDVLMLDAFSGDSVPVHLLTSEALHLYLRHLKPNGSLVFHISNRYLDLIPVVRGLAESISFKSVVMEGEGNADMHRAPSTYVVVSNNAELVIALKNHKGYRSIVETPQNIKLWTDDANDLFSIFYH